MINLLKVFIYKLKEAKLENDQIIDQFDQIKVGEIYEFDAVDDETEKKVTIQFKIVAIGWFSTPIKPGIKLYGLKMYLVDDPDKTVHFMSAISARPAKKVENV